MHIARIKNGIVVNLEVASQKWIDENQGVDGFTLVPYTNKDNPQIGLGWSEKEGFEKLSIE
jgi:hypothetical protein